MTYRLERRSQRDPFLGMGFDYAWRAEDAADNGSLTTSLVPYIGRGTLLPQGTGQVKRATSANLGGRQSISVDGVAATGGYSAVLLSRPPVGLTVVTVCYLAAVAVSGVCAFTVGGAALTGTSQILASTMRSQKLNTDALSVVTTPVALVLATVCTEAGVAHYHSRVVPVVSVQSGSLAGTTFHVMCRASNASVPSVMTGEWATTGIALRPLGKSDISIVMSRLGAKYGIAIAKS